MPERIGQMIDALGDDPRIGAEIGVYDAIFSTAILQHFHNLEMLLVDPWLPFDGGWDKTGNKTEKEFESIRELAYKRLFDVRKRCIIFEQPSAQAAMKVREGILDFVFIDGNHLYDWVNIDIYAWWPKLILGGLLAGHDYPNQAGVKQAVDEFVSEHRLELHHGKDSTWWIHKT